MLASTEVGAQEPGPSSAEVACKFTDELSVFFAADVLDRFVAAPLTISAILRYRSGWGLECPLRQASKPQELNVT